MEVNSKILTESLKELIPGSSSHQPTMADTIYVDEKAGADIGTSTGGQDLPYQTLQYAYIKHDGAGSYQVRKYEDEKEPEWAPASKAGLKKVANALVAHKKKEAKTQELEIRQKKESEARDKVLEEAKKIIVEKPQDKPEARKIRLDYQGEDIILHVEGKDGPSMGTRVKVIGMAALTCMSAYLS
jgi:asparaginyl-tRNA synthetase